MTAQVPVRPLREPQAPSGAARALFEELAAAVGGRASLASDDCLRGARDLWPRGRLWAREGLTGPVPDVVVWPESVEEIAAVIRCAGRRGVPVVAYGGGSGTAGAAVPVKGGVCLDLKRMHRLLALDKDALEVEVEAGIVGEHLERLLRRQGLTTGHWPDDVRAATLGGWLATRSAGWAAGRYGALEDLVASLTFVDGTGEAHTTARRPLAGWDLAKAIVGSEGCLGIVSSARLHVVPVAEARAFQAWRFGSMRDGLETVRALFRSGLRPCAVRLSDPLDPEAPGEEAPLGRRGPLRRRFDEAVGLPLARLAARATAGSSLGLNLASRLSRSCLLVLAFEGLCDLCELEAEEAGRLCQTARAEELGPDLARGWLERREAELFQASVAWDEGTLVEPIDLSVPWGQALEVHRRVREAVAPLARVHARVTHAYPEGCALEFVAAWSVVDPEEATLRREEIWRRALAAGMAAGALASHHGGIGLQRLNAFKGQQGEGLRVVHALKRAFDPGGVLNPGKLGG